MKKKTICSLLLALGLLVVQAVSAANIGYSNGSEDNLRANLFKMGTTTKQGMAMKLSGEKLKALKGSTISGIRTVFGSRNTTGKSAHLFISTTPDGTPLVEQDVTISKAAKWLDFTLDKSYTITGDEGSLYIGYTAEISTQYYLLSSDYTNDTKGVCYAYEDGQWVDIYGLGYGCVSVQAVINDAPAFTDALLKTFSFDDYYKAGTAYQFAGQIQNFGTETITSLDVELSTGAGETVKQTLSGLSIAPNDTYDITFPEYTAQSHGSTQLTLNITGVNGAADADASDNQGSASLYFYPQEMEKSLLLEGFTGQDCSNCPAGHTAVNNFMKQTTASVVEVMHHIGYYPDIYTMAADDAYLLFYGNNVTSYYAPAFMMNRATVPTRAEQPVQNVSSSDIQAMADELASHRPYVSLKLESDFDETTRVANVKLTVYAHENLPADQNVLNVVLVQDNIKGYQVAGGSNYNHGMVFRGTLTGNAWGKLLPTDFAAGDSTVWETTYTLPDSIYSDYWNAASLEEKHYSKDSVTIATDAANTYLVAYVGAYGGNNDCDGHEVYNCAQVKLGQSYTQAGVTGIQSVSNNNDETFAPVIRTDGRRITVEGCDAYTIYNIGGQRVPANSDLDNGLYIVRAVKDGKTMAKKLMIK